MILPLILWICLIVLVLPVYLVIVIPLGIWRIIVDLLAKTRSNIVEPLDSRDLVFTGDDYYGKPRKCVISCTVLSGTVTLDTLKERFQKNVLDKPNFFRLLCRPQRFLGYWYWHKTEVQVCNEISSILEFDSFSQTSPYRKLTINWKQKNSFFKFFMNTDKLYKVT